MAQDRSRYSAIMMHVYPSAVSADLAVVLTWRDHRGGTNHDKRIGSVEVKDFGPIADLDALVDALAAAVAALRSVRQSTR